MICPKCNYVFSEEIRVCPKCGHDMGEVLEKLGYFPRSSNIQIITLNDFISSAPSQEEESSASKEMLFPNKEEIPFAPEPSVSEKVGETVEEISPPKEIDLDFTEKLSEIAEESVIEEKTPEREIEFSFPEELPSFEEMLGEKKKEES